VLFLRAVFSCSAAASLSGRAAHVDEFSALVLSLAMLVTAAKLGGDLAGRFGQLAVLGELAAGMLLGNLPGLGPLQYLAADTYLDTFARLGMLLLLFEVGLELSVRELFAVGPSSLLVALFGTTASFAIGWGVAAQFLPSAPRTVHVFLAAAITATSVGITVRVLKDLRASRSGEAKIILGAAVVDDIIALVVLGLVTGGLAAGPATSASEWRAAMGLVAKTIGFLTLAIVLGVKLTPRWFRHAANLRAPGALLALGLCFCFFLSWAASAIGLAGLVGAFCRGARARRQSFGSVRAAGRALARRAPRADDVVPRADLLRARRLSDERSCARGSGGARVAACAHPRRRPGQAHVRLGAWNSR